jgi:hypothetical protein
MMIYQIPKTIENTRIADDSTVQPGDEEVIGDERDDEFAPYYNQGKVWTLESKIKFIRNLKL